MLQGAGLLAIAGGVILFGKAGERVVAGGVVVLAAVSAVAFGFYHYKTVDYYKNFVTWAIGAKPKVEYYEWFSPTVSRNYGIARTILAGSLESDEVFVWGDEPMIYALTKRTVVGRYTVKYHVLDFRAQKPTMDTVRNRLPKYVISFGKEGELPGLAELIRDEYMLEEQIDDGKIYRLRAGKRYN